MLRYLKVPEINTQRYYYTHSCLKVRNTNYDASSATMLRVADKLLSDDPGVGTASYESSGRIWAFCKRNATSTNAIIRYRNTKKTTNRDGTTSQHQE